MFKSSFDNCSNLKFNYHAYDKFSIHQSIEKYPLIPNLPLKPMPFCDPFFTERLGMMFQDTLKNSSHTIVNEQKFPKRMTYCRKYFCSFLFGN